MRRESLELLRCPCCGGALSLEAPDRELSSEGEIERGALRCAGCRQEYAVERGIPCFAPRASLTGLNRRMARFYDGFSWIYTGTMRLGFLPFGGERKARMAVLDHLRPAGARVLEVAVGPGPNVPFLLEMPGVREVYGLDVSLGQLLRGRARAARRGWPLALFQGEAEVLPFADAAMPLRCRGTGAHGGRHFSQRGGARGLGRPSCRSTAVNDPRGVEPCLRGRSGDVRGRSGGVCSGANRFRRRMNGDDAATRGAMSPRVDQDSFVLFAVASRLQPALGGEKLHRRRHRPRTHITQLWLLALTLDGS
jgi:uncharacterized protein YbaR (Trm112 family)